MSFRNVDIQIKDHNGNWLTIHTASNPSDVEIDKRLDEAIARYPGKQARAVEQSSRVVINIR